MNDFERNIPNVLQKNDGLRYVEVLHDFKSPEEFESFLERCTLIATGKNALVFLEPQQTGVLRLDLLNPLGYEWNKKYISKLSERYPFFSEDLSQLLEKNEWHIKPRSAKYIRKESGRELRTRIAAHNAAFRRNPLSTVPINCFYTHEDKPLAVSMPFLDGNCLAEVDPEATLTEDESALLCDRNPHNIMVDISNSLPQRVIIDLSRFTPSNQPLNTVVIQNQEAQPLS
jgi:hypothetical protein